MKNYSIVLISNKPTFGPILQRALFPEEVIYFNGAGYSSFSKLVNDAIIAAPAEIVIILSDKVVPTKDNIDSILSKLNEGYGFVGLFRFGFFGIKKEVLRRIGLFDENFQGGGYEDHDFVLRMIEQNIPMFIVERAVYNTGISSWNYSSSEKYWNEKWNVNRDSYPIKVERILPEPNYDISPLGPSVPTTFLPGIEKSYVESYLADFCEADLQHRYSSFLINEIPDVNSHLELGIGSGHNLRYNKTKNKFSVDNGIMYANYVGTTDDFFSSISQDVKFDVIFIDANHDYDFVLRDFNNAIDHCNKWIVLHDMVPPSEEFCQPHLCSDSYKLLYYFIEKCNFQMYTLNSNFGLTFIKMPAHKIYPEEKYKNITYAEFIEYIHNNYILYNITQMIVNLKK